MAGLAYQRALLKLSGEALAGGAGSGIDFSVVDRLADEIRDYAAIEVGRADVGGGQGGVRCLLHFG